ncbi:hypothetical protein BH23BAC1_BH23BAC1_25020 [soil metagenome]
MSSLISTILYLSSFNPEEKILNFLFYCPNDSTNINSIKIIVIFGSNEFYILSPGVNCFTNTLCYMAADGNMNNLK